MAYCSIAAGSTRGWGGRRPLRFLLALRAVVAWVALTVLAAPASAVSNNVRITGLTDVAFGSISSFSTDSVRNEDICVYSNTSLSNYQITATGSGVGQSFALLSGSNNLTYEVQWNASPGQTSGTSLTAGVPLTTQHSNATQQTCNSGPTSSASLIVIIRASAVASAKAGSYTGTLSLLVAPE